MAGKRQDLPQSCSSSCWRILLSAGLLWQQFCFEADTPCPVNCFLCSLAWRRGRLFFTSSISFPCFSIPARKPNTRRRLTPTRRRPSTPAGGWVRPQAHALKIVLTPAETFFALVFHCNSFPAWAARPTSRRVPACRGRRGGRLPYFPDDAFADLQCRVSGDFFLPAATQKSHGFSGPWFHSCMVKHHGERLCCSFEHRLSLTVLLQSGHVQVPGVPSGRQFPREPFDHTNGSQWSLDHVRPCGMAIPDFHGHMVFHGFRWWFSRPKFAVMWTHVGGMGWALMSFNKFSVLCFSHMLVAQKSFCVTGLEPN